jgi:hypothetical protein
MSMDPGMGQDQTSGQQQAQMPMDPVSNRLFHAFSDVDSDTNAQHHTLGPGVNQAASGAHSHDGNNSPLLFSGTITGSRGGNAAVANLISLICSQTNFVDGTTA